MKSLKRACCSPFTCKEIVAAVITAWLLACAGNVPEPGEGHVRWAGAHGYAPGLDTLRAGRGLFVQKCDGCHSLPRIRDYAPSDWPQWLDSMKVEFRNADAVLPAGEDLLIRNYLAVASGHWRDSIATLKAAKAKK